MPSWNPYSTSKHPTFHNVTPDLLRTLTYARNRNSKPKPFNTLPLSLNGYVFHDSPYWGTSLAVWLREAQLSFKNHTTLTVPSTYTHTGSVVVCKSLKALVWNSIPSIVDFFLEGLPEETPLYKRALFYTTTKLNGHLLTKHYFQHSQTLLLKPVNFYRIYLNHRGIKWSVLFQRVTEQNTHYKEPT